MKDKKNKCKQHESTIGKIIYGFLLFMPLMAIATTCLISTFNMATKQEAEIHYKYETNDVNSQNDLVIGRAYHMEIINDSIDSYVELTNGHIEMCFFNIYSVDLQNYGFEVDECLAGEIINPNVLIYVQIASNDAYIWFPSEDNYVNLTLSDSLDAYNFTIVGDFVLTRYQNYIIDNTSFLSRCENIPIESVKTNNVNAQDVFYDSINQVENSNLFSWASNNAIYTGVYNTCQQLSITNTFIPMLLTYWLIISVMYFLYDIILIILNILHRKIHELQESI